MASHMKIEKVCSLTLALRPPADVPHSQLAFTGSTLVGRVIMKAAATSNLKNVTLELGGKSPNIVFDDADIEQAVSWSTFGLFFNHGQTCCAGSRIYVQDGIYDKFLELLTAKVKGLKVGNPFDAATFQGPQTSQLQYDRIMAHVESGKQEGATVHLGGERHGTEGYFIQPTIFVRSSLLRSLQQSLTCLIHHRPMSSPRCASSRRRSSAPSSSSVASRTRPTLSTRRTTPCTDSPPPSSPATSAAHSRLPTPSRPEPSGCTFLSLALSFRLELTSLVRTQ